MIQPTDHPASCLDTSWIDLLRKEGRKATMQGQLTTKQLKLFYDQGWFKALVPKIYGGGQWSLMQVVRFEEAIGWAEGSAGWVFTLCSGAGWFGGYIDPEFAEKVFKPKKACLAGSGAVGGTGKRVGKYKEPGVMSVSGRWQYATGAPHATLFTANVYVGQEQQVRAVLLLPEEVAIKKSWKPIGLIASASESFIVRNAHVSAERWFDIDPDKAVINDPLYRTPFGPLAESTIAANLSGMALHFMEEVAALWENKQSKQKESPLPKRKRANGVEGAEALLNTYLKRWQKARLTLWTSVESLESFVTGNMALPVLTDQTTYQKKSVAVSKAAHRLASLCREIVNGLYPFTGLSGASEVTSIGQVWRDFQTGSQHAIFLPKIHSPSRTGGK